MRKIHFITLLVLLANFSFAQQKIQIHNSGNTMYAKELTAVDSIKLNSTYAKFKVSGEANTLNIQKTLIDSLTFTSNTVSLDKIYIIYNGDDNATIINPYAASGVSITAAAGTVTVTAASGIDNLEYHLLGSSANGSLELATDKDIRLVYNNLTLTNPTGAPISITGGKTTYIQLSANTTNALSDGMASNRNGTITTDGPIVIENSGALHISALKKHGINTSGMITVLDGTTTVSSAASDGFHAEGFAMDGGTVAITSLADGIDAGNGAINISAGTIHITSTADDVKAIKTGNNTISINGGNITMTVSGAQSKGISAKGNIDINNGNITATLSGIAVFTAAESGFDPSYATAVKSNAATTINGGTFNITVTAAANGGKGFSSDGGITVTGGDFTMNNAGTGATYTNTSGTIESYSASCFSTDTDISITGGVFHLNITGSGGKGLSANGNITIGSITGTPAITIANTASQFLVSGTNNSATAKYTAPKCIKADGNVTINNGTLTLSVTNQNGTCIDVDSILTVNGGNISCTVGGNQSKGVATTGDMNLNGGNITVNSTGGVVLETSGSGYDPSYAAALTSDTDVNIGGATVTISGTGAGFKGISSNGNINMASGTVHVTSSGSGTIYTGITGITDSYSSAAWSADGDINITGGSVTTSNSGSGGKGLKADGAIIIGSASGIPVLNITTTGSRFQVSGTNYNHPKTIVAVGAVVINNGTNTITSTDDGVHSDASVSINGGNNTIVANSTVQAMGEGVEAPIINFTGGVTNITASNDGINATYGTVSGGTESNDNSQLNISGGIVIVAGKDAIDSNGNITITGGTTVVCGVTNQPEEGIDFNGIFNMNGGYLISAGSNANMTKNFNSTSTQRTMYLKSNAQLAATSILHIENAAGTEMVTFKPKNGVYYFHFSSPNIAANTSYKVYFGGSYTGGSFVGAATGWGLYTGGTYSNVGGTLKTTFTSSANSTLNTQSF
ncbi:carbohydrate-binding domain-containing protein [Flavobacterium pallidum]|uniref:Carbohydrate-binding domain-containing protein n=1 Tax=Flavobacterium pallidum TaxID=2172098 RepID=A0A2S1SGC6_9FLAO|nr:carbohydrate-binding domain-containing protein [Flavobacterium pallidum]AWI25450.1 hypothetical protein HYN49_05800 [Flavobacterium pallidum]